MPYLITRLYCQLFVAAICLFTAITATGAETEKTFRVCADPKNPPFSDRQGNGFENKIAEMFAKELGQSVEYTWFPQRIGFIRNTLKAKKFPDKEVYKCDVVMGVPTGYELTLTTEPYYRSTYVLVYAKNRGWDDIKSPNDVLNLDAARKEKLRIAMFDRGPGTAWIVNNGLVDQGVPYQSMSGDPDTNTAMTIEKDLKAGVIDMAILWGPIAGYLLSNSEPGTFAALPMQSVPGLKFDFPISMGVRYGNKARRDRLNRLIADKSDEIKAILVEYNVPSVDENGRLISDLPH
jgi:quinoprotein dehydrogenase-associated probable ABC transporter substrate-binding protein